MLFPEGSVALVTGASRGIGRATALELSRQGATVVVNFSRSKEQADEVVCEIERAGGSAVPWQADVADEDQVRAMMRMVKSRFKRLDILVNNAGSTADGFVVMMSTEKWDHVLRVNLRGTFLCTREALKLMIHRRSGSIVNISSVSGLIGTEGQANYAASKGAVHAFTKTVAREGAGFGVRANAVAPGLVDTEMIATIPPALLDTFMNTIPMKRVGTPEEIASVVAFLASDGASYITGTVVSADGGLAP